MFVFYNVVNNMFEKRGQSYKIYIYLPNFWWDFFIFCCIFFNMWMNWTVWVVFLRVFWGIFVIHVCYFDVRKGNFSFIWRWKMDSWRWCCLIAALMYWLQESFDSELSSASFTQHTTTAWLHLHESKIAFGRKILKYIYMILNK